jgi:hypothetical protein
MEQQFKSGTLIKKSMFQRPAFVGAVSREVEQ